MVAAIILQVCFGENEVFWTAAPNVAQSQVFCARYFIAVDCNQTYPLTFNTKCLVCGWCRHGEVTVLRSMLRVGRAG